MICGIRPEYQLIVNLCGPQEPPTPKNLYCGYSGLSEAAEQRREIV